MPRYRITIEYDGTPFVGWQIQGEGASVQGALTAAIHAFTAETVTLKGAGRTDAGVHASGQVAHFELTRAWDAGRVREALNYHVRPQPISVLHCCEVPDTFDARFSATARHYVYRILNRRGPPALERNQVWWIAKPLDYRAMAEGARHLLGHHDFTTFRAAGCQAKSPMRTLDRLDVISIGEHIEIRASARSFLHNQVRSMAGSLKRVGEGAWPPEEIAAALAARDRARCAAVAPPTGLCLVRVDYPDES
jgi:tRNA pseudouridine38-40 synthase